MQEDFYKIFIYGMTVRNNSGGLINAALQTSRSYGAPEMDLLVYLQTFRRYAAPE